MSLHSHPPLTFPRILGDAAQSPILQMIKPEAPGQTAGAQRRRNSNPGPCGWQISALPPALHISSLDLSKKQSYLYEARDKEMHQRFFRSMFKSHEVRGKSRCLACQLDQKGRLCRTQGSHGQRTLALIYSPKVHRFGKCYDN